MKHFKNFWLLAGLLLGLMSVMSSCNDDDDDTNVDLPDNVIKFDEIALTGANEVQTPAVTTDGTGTLKASYDKDTKVLTYDVSWTLGNDDDETIGMHFHGPASVTENAPVAIGITLSENGSGGYNDPVANSGKVSGKTRALTQAEEDNLLAGLWYLNVHSTTYPAGELRGQVE